MIDEGGPRIPDILYGFFLIARRGMSKSDHFIGITQGVCVYVLSRVGFPGCGRQAGNNTITCGTYFLNLVLAFAVDRP